jgi:hypothetical protein
MRVRNMIIAGLAAITLGTMVRSGYGFNLSQMLGGGEEQNLNTFKLINVDDLKAMINARGNKVHVYDANTEETREKFGTIPGATLLSSHDNYPLSVLPPNKHATLVFYCANRH